MAGKPPVRPPSAKPKPVKPGVRGYRPMPLPTRPGAPKTTPRLPSKPPVRKPPVKKS